jgi:hypothetical protein
MLVALFGSLAVWAIKAGYRWGPLLAVAGYFVASMLILPKLPRLPFSPETTHRILLWVSSSYRRRGLVSAFLLSIYTVLLLLTGFKIREVPRWATTIGLVAGWFWVWYDLRSAKRYENLAHSQQPASQDKESNS